MPTPGRGQEGLRESFQEASNALEKLRASGIPDEKQLNLATSLIHDLERRVMRLSSPEERDSWRAQLDPLQHQLHEASGEHETPLSPTDPGLQEVVGDIDDLFSGMQLSDSNKASKQEFVPQAVPGRRYMKVVRGTNGAQGPTVAAVASPPLTTGGAGRARASPLPDAEDAVGQDREEVRVESDDEHGRYKHQENPRPIPLRVELPDMPLAAAAAAAGAASHGSADSTMARRGGEEYSDSDDESITSPENLGDGGFR